MWGRCNDYGLLEVLGLFPIYKKCGPVVGQTSLDAEPADVVC